MNIQIKGLFKAAAKPETLKNGKTSTKFYLDLDTETEYPTMCEIKNYDNKVDLSKLKPGDPVTVDCNLNGRKWVNPEGKQYFFQSLNAWRLKTEEDLPPVSAEQPEQTLPDAENNDLPF